MNRASKLILGLLIAGLTYGGLYSTMGPRKYHHWGYHGHHHYHHGHHCQPHENEVDDKPTQDESAENS